MSDTTPRSLGELRAVREAGPAARGLAGTAARTGPVDVDVYEMLRTTVLAVMTDRGITRDDTTTVRALIDAQIEEYQRQAAIGTTGPRLRDPAQISDRLHGSITNRGPFDRYLDDPERADEVVFKGSALTAFRRDGRLEVDDQPTSEAELRHSVDQMLADVGAAVDREEPIQVRHVLGNRARLSVSIPPVAEGLDGSLRIFREMRTDLAELVEWDALTGPAASLLAAGARTPQLGMLFTGGPGAGKTTLLAANLLAVPASVTTRIVQEVRELSAPHLLGGNWSPAGDVTLRRLVQRSLQFAPQLLVVSETLGEESFELLKAGNSGCSMWTTLHASSASMALQSLVSAALMAGENVPEKLVRSTFARLINIVVHCEAMPVHLLRPGQRRLRQVMEISVVPPQIVTDEFTVEPLFIREELGAPLEYTRKPIPAGLEKRMNRALPAGITVRGLCEGTDTLL